MENLAELQRTLNESVRAHCSNVVASTTAWAACDEIARLQAALRDQALARGPEPSAAPTSTWLPLEGAVLANHPDPLGALQRGEVPALILRGLVPQAHLDAQLLQLARWASRSTLGGGSPNRKHPCTRCVCNLCELSTSLRSQDVKGDECHSPRVNDTCPFRRHRSQTYDWGWKLYESLHRKSGSALHFNKSKSILAQLDEVARDCAASGCAEEGPCSPHDVLLSGLRRIVSMRPEVGARAVRHATEPTGEKYVPGVLRIHRPGTAYPLHFDTHHANAWATLRRWFCGEDVLSRSPGYDPATVRSYKALRRHHFSASVILTMQAPDRQLNPYDLRIYHARWPKLLRNCNIRSGAAYGIGQRLSKFPQNVVPHVDIRGEPGDLYIFNSEHVHITPTIRGSRSRAVVAAIAGYSQNSDLIEVWS